MSKTRPYAPDLVSQTVLIKEDAHGLDGADFDTKLAGYTPFIVKFYLHTLSVSDMEGIRGTNTGAYTTVDALRLIPAYILLNGFYINV